MVTIDRDSCIGCGSCVDICHEDCITLVDDLASVDHELCSTCTQCIAICPEQALSWNHIPPAAFNRTRLPSPEQLDELFKERRTIRHFRRDRIERALLEEIVGYGIYAPTNNYDLRAVVVDDQAVISELDQVCLRFSATIYRLIYKPKPVFNLLSRLTPALMPKDKVKIEGVLEAGHTIRFPAALVLIVGYPWIAHSEASAQYALCNMIFYAQAKGLGSFLWGGGKLALDRSRAARERLGLQRREHILGILGLGYPAVSFVNKVAGKTLPITWIEG